MSRSPVSPQDRSTAREFDPHRVSLIVEDLPAVQRVVNLLRARRYDIRDVHARRISARGRPGGWSVELAVEVDPSQVAGLRERLRRLVDAIEVEA